MSVWKILDQHDSKTWPKRQGLYAVIILRWDPTATKRVPHLSIGHIDRIPPALFLEKRINLQDRWKFYSVEGDDEIELIQRYCRIPDVGQAHEDKE